MGKQHTKFLLTEGKDDVYAIAGLMSNYVEWGASEEEWPVKIEAAGSIHELLSAPYLNAWFKHPGLEAIGLTLDANEDLAGRWARLRRLCATAFRGIPEELPRHGLVHEGQGQVRFGLWIMPDNKSPGMLETFLAQLVPASQDRLSSHARDSAATAKHLGAPFKEAHRVKAWVHTLLAWQDPPGRPFGEALKARYLDASCPAARLFAQWFIKLFGLSPERGSLGR